MLPTKICCRCGRDLPLSEFDFRSKARGELQARCKECTREYCRAHYQANKPAYIGRAKLRNAAEKKTKRQMVAEYKERPCADCGNRFPWYVMEFDHRSPGDKVGDIANMKNYVTGLPKFLAELAKCDVVCANCHAARTHHRKIRQERQEVS